MKAREQSCPRRNPISAKSKVTLTVAVVCATTLIPTGATAAPSTALTKQQARTAITFLDVHRYVALGTHIKTCKQLAPNSVKCRVAVPTEEVGCPAGNFSTTAHSWEDVVTNTLVTTTDWQGVIQYVKQTITQHGRTLPISC